jgi:hypothetical protein
VTPFCDDLRDAGPEITVRVTGPEIRVTTLEDFGRALARVAEVLRINEPTRHGQWLRETPYSHASHLIAHAETWREERRLEDAAHGATRALMLLELALRGGGDA